MSTVKCGRCGHGIEDHLSSNTKRGGCVAKRESLTGRWQDGGTCSCYGFTSTPQPKRDTEAEPQ